MVDALGALAAKKQALLALPRRRVQAYAAAAVLLLAALTLIRWPLRVTGHDPVFRPNGARAGAGPGGWHGRADGGPGG